MMYLFPSRRRIFFGLLNFLTRNKWICVFWIMATLTVLALWHSNSWKSNEDGVRVALQVLENDIRKRLDESEVIWKNGVAIRHKTEVERPLILTHPWMGSGGPGNILIWDFFTPTFNCPHLVERLGQLGDGGKWVCGINHLNKRANAKSCVVYSYGVAGDTSFEEDILTRTPCTLRAFDHTVDPKSVALTNKYSDRMSFDQIGLGVKDSAEKHMRTLKSEMNSHGDKFIDILKVDVEGAEFQLYPQIMQDFPNGLPFGQLLIELHLGEIPDENVFGKLKDLWEKLEGAGLRAFRSEPNLYVLYQGGKRNPICYEFSFLNVKVDHTLLHA